MKTTSTPRIRRHPVKVKHESMQRNQSHHLRVIPGASLPFPNFQYQEVDHKGDQHPNGIAPQPTALQFISPKTTHSPHHHHAEMADKMIARMKWRPCRHRHHEEISYRYQYRQEKHRYKPFISAPPNCRHNRETR